MHCLVVDVPDARLHLAYRDITCPPNVLTATSFTQHTKTLGPNVSWPHQSNQLIDKQTVAEVTVVLYEKRCEDLSCSFS